MLDKVQEECAVFGVSTRSDEAAGIIYNGLFALQHRGQEGAGIAVGNGNNIFCLKDSGLVSEVFTKRTMGKFPKGGLAIGHTKYSGSGNEKVQPFVAEFLTGRIATVHNGNILNAAELKAYLEPHGVDFTDCGETEVLSYLIAFHTVKSGDALEGVRIAAKQLKGAFSVAIMTSDNRLIALRDGNGFRPLCLGRNARGMAVASENCALDSCGFEFVRDVMPGEMVVIENGEIVHSEIVLTSKRTSLCIFEYVYTARIDSTIDGLSVFKARYNMGVQLAKEHPVEADIVSGVPDSGLEAAMGYAAESGIPLVPSFVRNRYIGRSFIFPTQAQRENAVRMKLNPLECNVKGKRVVLIDDSIVRGTTSARIISVLRKAGAKEVHMRISSPPFIHTCYFGTDVDSEDKLIANHVSNEEICKMIGADSLGYLSTEGLRGACSGCNLDFCTGCFNGSYGLESVDFDG